MIFDDLRSFIDELSHRKDLKVVEGADWDLEIGAITELMVKAGDPPALLFDKIKDYPKGYRVASLLFAHERRSRLAWGIPPESSKTEAIVWFKEKLKNFKPVEPVYVNSGPVKENALFEGDVDLYKFPAPKWHELDGGRYIGTGCMTILKDPESGYINVGCYRVMIHDKNTLSFYVSPGKDGAIIREKYWARNEKCPVVVCFGQEPLLWLVSGMDVGWGVSEFDFAGYLKGKPIEVVKGEVTGLPIPATAEIACEGEAPPPSIEVRDEGPFGEWTGYYGATRKATPVIRVKAIYYRNDPIIVGQPPMKPPYNFHFVGPPIHEASRVWNDIEKAGLHGVKIVWSTGPGDRSIIIVSLEQKYPGHAMQVGLFVHSLNQGGGGLGRMIIIVDDDIDPSNMDEVFWAICTRCDWERQVKIITSSSSPLDPLITPERRAEGDLRAPRIIIDACIPYHLRGKFPKPSEFSSEIRKKTSEKWKWLVEPYKDVLLADGNLK